MKKKKKKLPQKLLDTQKSIKTFNNVLDVPTNDKHGIVEDFNINFGLKCSKETFTTPIIKNFDDDINFDISFNTNPNKIKDDLLMKTFKHKLLPTDKQKIILLKYCRAHVDMYNVCVNYLKNLRKNIIQTNNITNTQKMRYCDLNVHIKNFLYIGKLKQVLCNEKKRIVEKYNVNTHILDYAMNDFITMYKSIVTNQFHGHVKNSRMRRIKQTKNLLIFKVEKEICNKTSFCTTAIGKTLNINPLLNYKDDCQKVYIVQYNRKKDEFLLLRRVPVERVDKYNNNSVISIDLGLRTLITGISENHIVEIGIDYSTKINRYIKQINKIKKYSNLRNKHKRNKGKLILKQSMVDKLVIKKHLRMENIIEDIQWKCANYLTENYNEILVGNASTSGMKKQNDSLTLECMKASNFYKFRSKIQYKCLIKTLSYKRVDESYTTKCCVKCGNVKDIGSSKIYTCDKCKLTYDRDVKSAGCIYLKALTLPN